MEYFPDSRGLNGLWKQINSDETLPNIQFTELLT